MLYIFVFLGEFGYELFNWQGLVRKFRQVTDPVNKVVVASRRGMDIWYETCDSYVDISECAAFKSSIAQCYWADDATKWHNELLDGLKAELACYLEKHLRSQGLAEAELAQSRFIFSCDKIKLDGIFFGDWPQTKSIYGGEGYKQNLYKKLEVAALDLQASLEKTLGLTLNQKYILVQGRTRDIIVRSKARLPQGPLLAKLAELAPVVALDFTTGRAHDSKSALPVVQGVHRFTASSSLEQALLIQKAAECVFFTEGDFGSHIYVPPFMGKDVLALAPREIFHLDTTPIAFWNAKVFRFGGQIIPFESEEWTENAQALDKFCALIGKRLGASQAGTAPDANLH